MPTQFPVAQCALDGVRKEAASAQAEAFLLHSRIQTEEWSGGRPEEITQSESAGLGLRVIEDGRLGFGYSNRLDTQSLAMLARQTLMASRCTVPDPCQVLLAPDPRPANHDLDLVDTHLNPEGFRQRASFLSRLEQVAKRLDPRITQILQGSYREGRSQVCLVNSAGISASYEQTQVGFSVACVAVEGAETQMGYAFQSARHYEDLQTEKILQQAVHHAVALLGGTRVPSGRYDLLMDPMVAAEMLEVLADALCADQIQKGKSFLGTKFGQRVGAPVLTLVDDGCLPRGMGSSPFDAEGGPTQKTVLVEQGVLKSFLYDSYTARKAGVSPTGNAGRSSYKSIPEPAVTNLFVEPGTLSLEEMVSKVQSGIHVFSMMGLHTVDTISGDFSLGIMGQRIEKGQRTHAVRGVTIAGNFLELLQHVEAVGADRVFLGSIGAPTLWIRDISVGGE